MLAYSSLSSKARLFAPLLQKKLARKFGAANFLAKEGVSRSIVENS
jgi:hypothetical protein